MGKDGTGTERRGTEGGLISKSLGLLELKTLYSEM
mgnify:CR=1 FL=1